MKSNGKFPKKAASSIIAIVILAVMLAVTTCALVLSFVSVEENRFETGTVQINLNDGKTVLDGSDINIEPGYTVVRDFTLENTGSADAYIRLYLENVEGGLQNALLFSIYKGDELLYGGHAYELTKAAPCTDSTPLSAGETRTYTLVIKMDEAAGNTYQQGKMSFDMTADAVQAKNNPDKLFE